MIYLISIIIHYPDIKIVHVIMIYYNNVIIFKLYYRYQLNVSISLIKLIF